MNNTLKIKNYIQNYKIFFKFEVQDLIKMGNQSDKSKKKSIEVTEEQMNSLLANTSFTREEILQWHDGFIV